MKTIRKITYAILLVTAFGLVLAGCKKEDDNPPPKETTDLQKLSKDVNTVENASDEVMNDVNNVLSGGQLKSTLFWPCNVTIDSATIINDSITYYLTYHGLNCIGTVYRTGNAEVKRKVGEYWVMPGATVKVTLINYHVIHIMSGHSVTFNGSKTFQNVTGGHVWMVGYELSSYVDKVWGTIQATFEDNSTRTWNISRQRTFTGVADSLIMAIDGFGSADGYDNLVVWGLDRNGTPFYSQVNQTVIYKQKCQWDPCSGIQNLLVPSLDASATLTFGYDDNNQPITGDECPTKYRLDWVLNGNSGTFYLYLH
jgi:hypothetical protein